LREGTKVLSQRSKDLEITAYVIEALTRLHGFAGLRDGFRLARELVAQFWDNLYPLPDEEGVATRVAPLTGLNGDDSEGTLIVAINQVPLTEGSSVGPFALYQYQQAVVIAQTSDEGDRNAQLSRGGVSMEMVSRAVSETPAAFFVNLVDDISAALDAFASLNQVLEEKAGSNAPPGGYIRSSMNSCLDAVRHIAAAKLESAAPAAADEEGSAEAGGGESGSSSAPAGAVHNREEAFRSLLKVAEFFRRTEPHSPVSYALQQVVRWGRMSLPELLTELITDESVRQGAFKQVGIRPEESSSG
jgi:type VI secretion system protein ImpA